MGPFGSRWFAGWSENQADSRFWLPAGAQVPYERALPAIVANRLSDPESRFDVPLGIPAD